MRKRISKGGKEGRGQRNRDSRSKRCFKKPSAKTRLPAGPDIKDVEIIEGDLIPQYKVSLPKFSEKERELLNEIREKLVEVAVSKGEEFRIDESTFMSEVKEFLKDEGGPQC
jgi:flagellar protein FlaI